MSFLQNELVANAHAADVWLLNGQCERTWTATNISCTKNAVSKECYDQPEARSAKEEAQVVLCQFAQCLSILADGALKDKLLLFLQAQCMLLSAESLQQLSTGAGYKVNYMLAGFPVQCNVQRQCKGMCWPLAYLELQNALLNAASDDEAGHMNGFVLAQPVNPVGRLVLHCSRWWEHIWFGDHSQHLVL